MPQNQHVSTVLVVLPKVSVPQTSHHHCHREPSNMQQLRPAANPSPLLHLQHTTIPTVHVAGPLNRAEASHFKMQHHERQLQRHSVRVQAWTQVIDQNSGKPYYWNTATNETAWELPSAAAAATAERSEATTTSSSSSSSPADDSSASEMLGCEALFDVLAAAYGADGSGMEFWEVARAHRQHGVFDTPFFEYLEQRQRNNSNDADRELAFKMMCRLSNPLLRQPAPFE